MGALTKEQLDAVWNEAGLKYRIGRFHGWLLERNLLSHITKKKLTDHVYDILEAYLVKGVKETKDGRTILPTRTSEPHVDSESEGEGR